MWDTDYRALSEQIQDAITRVTKNIESINAVKTEDEMVDLIDTLFSGSLLSTVELKISSEYELPVSWFPDNLKDENGHLKVNQTMIENQLSELNNQEADAMKVIEMQVEYELHEVDALSKLEINNISTWKIKEERKEFTRDREAFSQAAMEARSLSARLHDQLDKPIVFRSGTTVLEFEGASDKRQKYREKIDDRIGELKNKLALEEGELKIESRKKPLFGKSKHAEKLVGLNKSIEETKAQIDKEYRDRSEFLETKTVFPDIGSFFDKLPYSKRKGFLENYSSNIEAGITLGELLELMKSDVEQSGPETFPEEKQALLDAEEAMRKEREAILSKYKES